METDSQSDTLELSHRYAPTEDVLHQELDGEVVILDLESERYFGLDEIGARMWMLLLEHESLQAVYDAMIEEYEVDAEILRKDLSDLVSRLVADGLLRRLG